MDEKNRMEDTKYFEELKKYDSPTITNVIATYPEKPEFCLGLYDPWEDSWYTNEETKCMYPELGRQIGYAVTVTLGLPDKENDHITFKDLYQVLADSPKPTVLCIKQDFPERLKKKNGLAGGNMMTAFKSLGCVGVISDGPSRDVDEVRNLGIQYMLTGVTAGHGSFAIKAINTTVNICDMEVNPGEIIHMDENGAVKFPAKYLAEVARRSQILNQYESRKQQLFAVNNDPDVMYEIKKGTYQEKSKWYMDI
nr:RraA family protein [uncultured Blautia sp.]